MQALRGVDPRRRQLAVELTSLQIMNEMIDEQIAKEAARKANIRVEDDEIDALLKRHADASGNVQKFNERIALSAEGLQGVRELIRLQLIREKLAGIDEFDELWDIGGDEVDARHDRRYVSHAPYLYLNTLLISVPPNASQANKAELRSAAESLRKEIVDRKPPFSGLVGRPSVTSKSVLIITQADNPALWQAFALSEQGDTQVVEMPEAFFVARLLFRRSAQESMSSEAVSEASRAERKRQRRDFQVDRAMERLREEAIIEVHYIGSGSCLESNVQTSLGWQLARIRLNRLLSPFVEVPQGEPASWRRSIRIKRHEIGQ
jgi:hypothetical protein